MIFKKKEKETTNQNLSKTKAFFNVFKDFFVLVFKFECLLIALAFLKQASVFYKEDIRPCFEEQNAWKSHYEIPANNCKNYTKDFFFPTLWKKDKNKDS